MWTYLSREACKTCLTVKSQRPSWLAPNSARPTQINPDLSQHPTQFHKFYKNPETKLGRLVKTIRQSPFIQIQLSFVFKKDKKRGQNYIPALHQASATALLLLRGRLGILRGIGRRVLLGVALRWRVSLLRISLRGISRWWISILGISFRWITYSITI